MGTKCDLNLLAPCGAENGEGDSDRATGGYNGRLLPSLSRGKESFNRKARHDNHERDLSGTRMETAFCRVHQVRGFGASDRPRAARGVLDAGLNP